MGAPVRFQKAVPRSKEKRRSGAPRGAPVRVMDRQFPPAGGTGATVRSADGCGDPRPRISALRYPLLEDAKGSKPTIWTEASRDAPRGNAPPRLTHAWRKSRCRSLCRRLSTMTTADSVQGQRRVLAERTRVQRE